MQGFSWWELRLRKCRQVFGCRGVQEIHFTVAHGAQFGRRGNGFQGHLSGTPDFRPIGAPKPRWGCYGALPEKMRVLPVSESPRRGRRDHSQGWRARQRPKPLGAGKNDRSPVGAAGTTGGGGRASAEGANKTPGRGTNRWNPRMGGHPLQRRPPSRRAECVLREMPNALFPKMVGKTDIFMPEVVATAAPPWRSAELAASNQARHKTQPRLRNRLPPIHRAATAAAPWQLFSGHHPGKRLPSWGTEVMSKNAAVRPWDGCRCRGRRLRSGFRPPSAPAPDNGISFWAPICLRRPSRGSARRFAARPTPGYAPTPPYGGLPKPGMPRHFHGGRALPDFTKSLCFPKWWFYRPYRGTWRT